MSRSFLLAGILLNILFAIISIFQGTIYWDLAQQTFTLDSFPSWYVLGFIIFIFSGLPVFKYFYERKFITAFWTALIYTLISVIQFGLINSLLHGDRTYAEFYPHIMTLAALAVGAYGSALIFSNAGQRIWLKIAGIVSLLSAAVLLYATFILVTPTPQNQVFAIAINKWMMFVWGIIPLMFAANFATELKTLRPVSEDLPSRWSAMEIALWVAAIVSIPFIVRATFKLSTESYWVIKWNEEAMERSARLAEPFEARKFVTRGGDTVRYLLFIPEDYDSTKKYPLVVGLHHGGSHGTDNIRQIDGSQPVQLIYQLRKSYPAILFVPQCPQGMGFGGIEQLRSIDSLVFEAIDKLEDEFSVDERRRYVTGISGGGYGSWHFLAARPNMFAAAVPICGGGNAAAASTFAHVPVWAFHGENDRSVPVDLTREMIKAMTEAGGKPKYTEFPGAGHNIWDLVSTTPGVVEWMFAQERPGKNNEY